MLSELCIPDFNNYNTAFKGRVLYNRIICHLVNRQLT